MSKEQERERAAMEAKQAALAECCRVFGHEVSVPAEQVGFFNTGYDAGIASQADKIAALETACSTADLWQAEFWFGDYRLNGNYRSGWNISNVRTGKYIEQSSGPDKRFYPTLQEAMQILAALKENE